MREKEPVMFISVCLKLKQNRIFCVTPLLSHRFMKKMHLLLNIHRTSRIDDKFYSRENEYGHGRFQFSRCTLHKCIINSNILCFEVFKRLVHQDKKRTNEHKRSRTKQKEWKNTNNKIYYFKNEFRNAWFQTYNLLLFFHFLCSSLLLFHNVASSPILFYFRKLNLKSIIPP